MSTLCCLYNVWVPGVGFRNVLASDHQELVDVLGVHEASGAALLFQGPIPRSAEIHFRLPADREQLIALRIAAALVE